MVYAFFTPDASRVWTLPLLIPLLALRWTAYHRLVTRTPLDLWLVALLLLGIVNIYTAPYTRGDVSLTNVLLNRSDLVPWAWVMLGRPVMGIALFFGMVEFARLHGIRSIVIASVALGLLLSGTALVSTQWNTKSDPLRPLIDLLPSTRDLFYAPGGFNANEIGGALAWLTPLCAGLALARRSPRWIQAGAVAAFALLLLALFLGQSRLALIGVIFALGVLIFLLIRSARGRAFALVALSVLIVAEVLVATHAIAPPTEAELMEERDEARASRRFEMWRQALAILRDHPLTGVGANMFRDGSVRAVYPVPTYETRVLPHAHNEFLQIAADLGIPGLIVFIGIYASAGWMIWRCWRAGDGSARAVAAAAGAGLLAHAVYGMGDAVTLWDRFTFVFWWLLGVAGAQYVCLHSAKNTPAYPPLPEKVVEK